MVTYTQYCKKARITKKFKSSTPKFEGSPFKSGVCLKVYIEKPKKPNSAKRPVAKVKLSNARTLLAHIPGFGHKLTKNDEVLVRGGGVPDLPGVLYHIMRNKKRHTEPELIIRTARRSKYGIRKPMEVKYARRLDPETGSILLTARGRHKQVRRDKRKKAKGLYRTSYEPLELEYLEDDDETWVEGIYEDQDLLKKRIEQLTHWSKELINTHKK